MSMCNTKISIGSFYGYKRYYKTTSDKEVSPLKYALGKCDDKSHTFMIQDKKTKYRSYVNIPYNKLKTIWTTDECMSEIIKTDRPLKMFFDLDIIEKDEDKEFYNDDYIIDNLVEAINEVDLYAKPLLRDKVVYSKCRGYCEKKKAIKLSYHIIIDNSVYFKNIEDYKRFTLTLKTNLHDKSSILYEMIDWCMGSKNQVFKLPHQSKAGENNINRIQRPASSRWSVLNFIVSNVLMNTHYKDKTPTCYDVRDCDDDKMAVSLTAHSKIKSKDVKKIIVSKSLNAKLLHYKTDVEFNEKDKDIYKDLIEPHVKDLEYGTLEYYLMSIPNRPYVAYDMFIIIGMACKRISTEHLKNSMYGLELWARWTSQYNNVSTSSLQKQYDSFTSDRGYGFPVLTKIASIFNPTIGCHKRLVEPLFRFDKDKDVDLIEVDTKFLGTKIDILDVKKKYDILYVKAPMASGKSYMLRKIYETESDSTVCLISCKRSFASAMTAELTKYGFVNYMSVDFKNNIRDYDRIICSIETLRYCRNKYDYLLIDESESIATNLIGGMNMKLDPISNIIKYYDLVNNSSKVFVMDAYLCNRSKNMINDILKTHRKTVYIKNNYKPEKRFIHRTNQLRMVSSINDNIKNDKEVVFVVNSLAKQMSMMDTIEVKEEDSLVYNKHNKLDTSLDVNTEWKNKKLLTYTPTLTAGISYDVAPKDNLYMYLLNTGSCLLRDTIQAFKRVRKFKNNNIEYFAFKMPTEGELSLTLGEVKTCEENYIESLNKTMPWLDTASKDPRLRYIVNLIIFCRLEENLNEVCFYELFNTFMESENITVVKNNIKNERIESTYNEDLEFDWTKTKLVDKNRFDELHNLKEESGMLNDVKDYEEYTKYKFVNNYVDRTQYLEDTIKTFNRLGAVAVSSCFYKNVRFKKFMKDVVMYDVDDEIDVVDKSYEDLLMDRINKFTKARDYTEITEKYLMKYYFIAIFLNKLNFIEDKSINWDRSFLTQDLLKLRRSLETISYRSFSLLFNDKNLRLKNIEDNKLDNISTKQILSIFNNLLKEELGLEIVSNGRKKIKGKENKIFSIEAVEYNKGADDGIFLQKEIRDFTIDNIDYNKIDIKSKKKKFKVVKFVKK